jgi:hypothetical protein
MEGGHVRKRRANEKKEENKFKRKVEARGWEAIKLSMLGPYGRKGRNDRLVLAPWRTVVLFEFKDPDGKGVEKMQAYMHRKYRKMGFPCHVVYTCEQAWKILEKEIESE